MRKLNYKNEIKKSKNFIKETLDKNGFNKVVLGISGGIDSAVVAALSVEALGSENVIGFMLPYQSSHPNSLNHAKLVAEKFHIKYRIIDISKMVNAYFSNFENDADILRKGNRMARERMSILYDQSSKHNALVIGTGNKSELMVGYMTQYGDGACAFEPIGHLYKTEIFEIAKLLGVPKEIIEKKPTADLWQDQTDEDEMGISYNDLDNILYQLIDLKNEKIIGFSDEKVKIVKKMIKSSEFKRKLPDSMEDLWDSYQI